MAALIKPGQMNSLPALECIEFTPNDGVEVLMTNVQRGERANPKAFIVNANGTINITNLQGVVVPIPVLKGVIYPIVARTYENTGKVGVTKVVGLL